MTKLTLSMITAAGLALSGPAFLGCSPSKHTESAGEFIDDSVITTKVKAAFLEEPSLKSFQISVKSYKGVVQLSGFVDSAESVRLAGKVASSVQGVSKVANDLIVK
jgi:osmotically-inducible protein OsmY